LEKNEKFCLRRDHEWNSRESEGSEKEEELAFRRIHKAITTIGLTMDDTSYGRLQYGCWKFSMADFENLF